MLIGISGAGAMGSTIALAFAQAGGHNIVLSSSSEEFAASGKAKIAAKLKKLAEKGKMTQEAADEILGRIETGPKEKLAPCDLVMESTSEDMTKKKNLFLSLQEICKPDVIFATNTSSLSITEMALGIDRPVVGMHFFNPADMMKLVEIIPGMNTPPEVVEKVTVLASEIGKTPVRVQEAGGFVVNRILIPMINEAIGIYAEGLATADDIDTAMKLGANHPIGPSPSAISSASTSASSSWKYSRPSSAKTSTVRTRFFGRWSGAVGSGGRPGGDFLIMGNR